jgi:formyltetrahydrofolate deformylase
LSHTSHYVTEELDEGPIIEQDITRVSYQLCRRFHHERKRFERTVLARAIKLHAERKVMVYSNKTVVFYRVLTPASQR